MAAPRGNKNAVKGASPKTKSYPWRLSPEAYSALKRISANEKISISQVLEKTLLEKYPDDFSGVF